jgi:peroxiredoxin
MTENKIFSQRSWWTIGLVLVLCVVNVLLIKQNLNLRRQLAAGAKTFDLTTNFLQPGDVVAPVTATDLDGHPYQIDYKNDGRQHLLLFFSPDCPYCQQQSQHWRDLLDNIDINRFTVVGIVSDQEDKLLVSAHAEGAGYFKTKTSLPLVFFDSESLGRYKLTATPTTLLINDDGKVKHAWIGKWDTNSAREVAAALQ